MNERTDDRKDSSLTKDDFKEAFKSADEEEQALNKIIREIKMLSADGIKQGEELKTAAINYYVALKALQTYDRKEIEQQQINLGDDQGKVRVAQDSLLKLAVDKRKFYEDVYKRDNELREALGKFEAVNGL